MKITLTNNYYQGLAVNKNSQNKKDIHANKTVGNGVAFGGPELTRRAASGSSTRTTQALAQTAQRAVRLFNVERQNSDSKNKVVNINGVMYKNPEYYQGTKIIKSCVLAIRTFKNQTDGRTAETYEKPNFAANGQLTGCAKLTYEYQGRGDHMLSTSYTNLNFDAANNRMTYDNKILEYKGFEPNMTKQILVDPTYDKKGNLIGCKSLTYEYQGRGDKKTKEYIEKPKYDENGKIVSSKTKEIVYDEGRPDQLQSSFCEWPTYDGNRKLTKCGQVTYRFYKGQEGKVKSETYTGYVTFNNKGYVAECAQVNTRYYEDRGDRRTAKTYENPKYDENGKLMDCAKLTYEYQGREDNLERYELQAPVYNDSGRLISFQTQGSYYRGRNDKIAVEVIDNQGNDGMTRTIMYENGDFKTENLK